ncbi:hypothetical protein [Halopseudomonas sp.]|uniref:hypothetical protein n=1 Tax=Halopseudomonas sp. TaxID=2901191 RepID=UPI00311E4F5B
MNDPVHCPILGAPAVLLVNVSTVRPPQYYDPACVLQPGCHPFVINSSWVVYKEAVVSNVARLDGGLVSGVIHAHDPVSQAVYSQVRSGFDVSIHVTVKIKRFIKSHNI